MPYRWGDHHPDHYGYMGVIQLMATLYKRANARQKRLLKIIEGAVKNAFDAHQDLYLVSQDTGLMHLEDKNRFARSIAKRAVGTLSSQLDEVLALDGHKSDVTKEA